jgi:hypothetical protein
MPYPDMVVGVAVIVDHANEPPCPEAPVAPCGPAGPTPPVTVAATGADAGTLAAIAPPETLAAIGDDETLAVTVTAAPRSIPGKFGG